MSSQIQRAITDANNEYVSLQIQATLWSGQGQVPPQEMECPAFNLKFRSSSRDEFPRNLIRDEDEKDTHETLFQLLQNLWPY